MAEGELPIPPHFDPERVGEIWRVPYQQRASAAEAWANEHGFRPAAQDHTRIGLVAVDVQNTFCIPGFELFVAGRSATGAVDDNRRLCEFIYRNLHLVTRVFPTMDTHQAIQIFHSVFLVNDRGEHPDPFTLVCVEDVDRGVWRINPEICPQLGMDEAQGRAYLSHYVRSLRKGGKYDLTIWPYHAMLGGVGHALVSAVEEAVFFHGIARRSRPEVQVKGDNPLTEHYSVLGPEVTVGSDGTSLAGKNSRFIEALTEFDVVIIAGQAKSHCVAWTIDDLLEDPRIRQEHFASKVYLLEDCTSPVVVQGVVDYTEQANAAFRRFSEAGMHVVRSTDPIGSWPDIDLRMRSQEAACRRSD